jgi:DNA invertase Pin-like site-specific DNA recombinase
MPTPIPAAAYYRFSDDRQENSIARQRSQVEPYAAKHGYQIVREYTDEGISGDVITKRREFQRMLRDAQAGQFKAILCDDKDRFGRFDAIDLGEVVAPLRRKGVWVETVAQGRIDWNTFAGRITDAILQEAKNMEQEAISRRVLSSQLLKAQRGETTGGRATYGYRQEGDPPRLVPDGRKAEVVQLIFRLYDQGQTLFAIAEELFQRGVASPRGKSHWTRPVLQRILINRRYVGDWTWGVHPQGKRHHFGAEGMRVTPRSEGRGPRRNPTDAWLVIPDHHEALVTRDQFERVQARLKANQTATAPQGNGGPFVLNRLLVCSHCGSFLNGVTSRRQRVYVCRGYLAHGRSYCRRNSVAEKPLLDFLLRKLQQAFLDPENLAKFREEIAREADLARAPDNLARLQRQAEDLAEKVRLGNERLLILPPDRLPGVIDQLRRWERERADALAELHQLDTDRPEDKLEKAIADAEAILWRLREAIEGGSAAQLREVLRDMVSRVEMRWTHQEQRGQTRCRLSGGVVRLRVDQELSRLSPSVSQ